MPQPWKNGLFNCMPCGLCMKGFFCPCILVGQNHARIRDGEQDPESCSGWCVGWCGLTYCLGAGWILQMMDRTEMNRKHDLEGGAFGACCRAFWCNCCEAIQTSKELDYVQVSQLPKTGYMAQETMVAQPQEGGVAVGYQKQGL